MLMMNIEITTPALFFPAITILFLAYSNRFLTIAGLIRQKHDIFIKTQSTIAEKQIVSFSHRLQLIVVMELFAVLGIISCIVAMGFIFLRMQLEGNFAFAVSIVFIVLSLIASVFELMISTRALRIELEDMKAH
jgi:hypothetical protein